MNLQGRVALVTGGAVRIGRAISLALAAKGMKVAINYNSSTLAAQQTLNEMQSNGGEAIIVQADVSVGDNVKRLFDTVIDRYGRVDVLINNAAIFYHRDFAELTEEDFDLNISINLKGPYLCCLAAGKQMLKQKEGKIINIADVGGITPWTGFVPYCISKAGVIMLTKAMAKSLGPYVQVNAIAPGPVLLPEGYTPEQREQAVKPTVLKKEGSPEDITRTILFLLEGSDYITGDVIAIDGGRLLA
ncbi:MAG TPA: SDR family oxidoreductase [Blastocatellia bacterium]|nr:SDR family oxidoreductase [Blastocatellia bacterium]